MATKQGNGMPGSKGPTGGPRRIVPRIMMRVWDAPTRLFHWAIVLLIAFSYVSIHRGWTEYHFLSGYTVLALLLFRIAWGFVGSQTSRFGSFLRSPVEGLRHLAHFHRREPDTEIGHNAAGGWMVLALLAAIAVQAGTGLFSNDDILSEGPLAHLVPKALSDRISGWHAFSFNVLLGLMALHVLVVLLYALVKRHDLVRPMLTGRKRLPATMQQPRMASSVLAAGLLALAACVVWVVVTRI
jgi:cytochrome b